MDDQAVTTLVSMGFDSQQATKALRESGGDINTAINKYVPDYVLQVVIWLPRGHVQHDNSTTSLDSRSNFVKVT